MKTFFCAILLVVASKAYAINDCRNLNREEKQEMKQASCQAIAKLLAGHEKLDIGSCLTRGKFNICENMDFGATGTNLEVDGLVNSMGMRYACTMDVTSANQMINVDCNGNY